MRVADVKGVDVAGLMIDAGTVNSPLLLQVGTPHATKSDPSNPTTLHDVFFRIGGPHVGKATVSLEVNSDNVLLDHIWAWRADHGVDGSFGWEVNTADTGVIVNGDNVTATGLFVEHYQKYNTIWNGEKNDDPLPERTAVRPAQPGRLPARRRPRLGRLQSGRLGQAPRAVGRGQLRVLQRQPDDPRHRGSRCRRLRASRCTTC